MLKEVNGAESLKELGEFGMIRRIAPLFHANIPPGIEGIGNDCAVIPLGTQFSSLITTDLLVENTHFIKEQISPEDLGYKSLAVNLSDLAAMGGKPQYAFLSLALPTETSVNWIDAFFSGFRKLAEETGVLLLGGDTTRSKLTFINVLLIGVIETKFIKRRSQAVAGDLICCTDYLGDSGGGLKILLEELPRDEIGKKLINFHFRPQPHIQEGDWLSKQPGVHAMMDVSDGLASDIERIMEESNCGAHIEVDRLPISNELQHASKQFGWQAKELALSAGEDYCILVTVDPRHYPALNQGFLERFKRPLYPLGTIQHPSAGCTYTFNKSPYTPSSTGFDHFKS